MPAQPPKPPPPPPSAIAPAAAARRPAAPPPPPPPPMDDDRPDSPELKAEADRLHADLPKLDYFQVLRLKSTASPREIKEAYYRESRLFHPDRFSALPDEGLKAKVNTIFKRVTEAYVVLRDDRKRAKYVADVAGPERASKLRFTEASESEEKAEKKKAIDEQVGTTPKGRECYKNGVKELEAKRIDAALRQLKMALVYEPANALYKEKYKEAEAEWEKGRPREDLRIK